MYDEINLFLNCTSTVFIVLGVWNILDIKHKVNNISIMVAMGIINFDNKLREIEKAIGIPPRYEDNVTTPSVGEEGENLPDSSLSAGEVEGEIIDEAEQIPYTPSPPFGQTPSFSIFNTTPTPINLDGID